MTARRDVKLTRRQARRRARTLQSWEPCTCGGRFTVLRDDPTGLRARLGHSSPPCIYFDRIETEAAMNAYVAIQRRAAYGTVYTVPWFPEMQSEMPGYIIASLWALVDVSGDLGLSNANAYAEALAEAACIDEETALDVIALGLRLGLVGGAELPPGTSIISGPIGGGPLN